MSSNQTGFTLIELVLTVIIVGICFLSLVAVFSTSLVGSSDSEHTTIATFLAQEKMEQILADKNGRGYGYIVNSSYPAENPVPGYPGYSRSVIIAEMSDYKIVVVKVSHPESPDVELTTEVTNY